MLIQYAEDIADIFLFLYILGYLKSVFFTYNLLK